MSNRVVSRFILSLPLYVISPITFAVNSLDVEFSGELISTACQVAPDSLKQKIALYNLRWQFINKSEKSAITPFSIAINKCSETDLQKSIKLTWQSNQLVNIGTESYLVTKGDSGVLLGLVVRTIKPLSGISLCHWAWFLLLIMCSNLISVCLCVNPQRRMPK